MAWVTRDTDTNTPTHNFDTDKVLEGVLVSTQENVGPNNSKLYTFEKKDTTKVAVWGNSFLDREFPKYQNGDVLRVEFLGMATNEKTGRKFKNYKVSVWQE